MWSEGAEHVVPAVAEAGVGESHLHSGAQGEGVVVFVDADDESGTHVGGHNAGYGGDVVAGRELVGGDGGGGVGFARRDTYGEIVYGPEEGEVVGGDDESAPDEGEQLGVGDISYEVDATAEHVDLEVAQIEAYDLESGAGVVNGHAQSALRQSEYADYGFFLGDASL